MRTASQTRLTNQRLTFAKLVSFRDRVARCTLGLVRPPSARHERDAVQLECSRVSKQSIWNRRILLTGSSAPLKGTHMIMTEDYRRILARAAHGQLPQWVVEQSEPDFRVIRELYEEKCLEPIPVGLRQSLGEPSYQPIGIAS